MSDKFDRPKEIIEFCLKPSGLAPTSKEYREVYARLEHVIKTYQSEILKEKKPVAIDFSQMKTITINEDAHGHD
ncbi:MAG: hypothetical protein K2P80_05925 [Beijerinckiaceae bacterium]|nr:hypothetical protein [Beijerinckiaceae bacterium]